MPVPGRWYGRLAALLAAVALAATLGYVLTPGARARSAAIRTADLAAAVVRVGQVTATTQYPIFMKVAGIPGQSTDPDHRNWISLTSWQWDITGTGTSFQPLRQYPLNGAGHNEFLHWDGSTWTTVPAPGPREYGLGYSCTAVGGAGPDNVWAVGSVNQYPLIARLSCGPAAR